MVVIVSSDYFLKHH